MRTLTVLFSDLRECTARVELHGEIAATTLIADPYVVYAKQD